MSNLKVSPSPHIHTADSTRSIMADVVIALIPATVFGVLVFGYHAALLIVTCVLSAVLSEFIWCTLTHRPQTVDDLSAVVTGLLLALNLPPRLPAWMAVIGSAVAIIVVKEMFGGLGCNFANPAITARIVLMVSFPAAMTRFYEPFSALVTEATPLAGGKSSLLELIIGTHGGCIGETSAVMLLLGFAYLLIRRVISPVIPLCFIGTVAVLTLILGGNPVTAVFSGGLLLGAVFMATDYVTSPATPLGGAIFGIGCGLITVVIRSFGSLPEGVSYSILLMNILVVQINRLTRRKPFGWEETRNEN